MLSYRKRIHARDFSRFGVSLLRGNGVVVKFLDVSQLTTNSNSTDAAIATGLSLDEWVRVKSYSDLSTELVNALKIEKCCIF